MTAPTPPVRAISPGGSKAQSATAAAGGGSLIHHGSTQDSVSSSKDSAREGDDELSKDAAWELMFNNLKAIKEKTGTCNLPDKKGDMAKWVYAQRKAFRRLQFSRGTPSTRARVAKLESIGFEFSSSSYVSWDIMFEKYLKREEVEMNDDEVRKLKLWMSNQRLEYSRKRRNLPNNITEERIAKLEAAGFQWVGRTGKPNSSSAAREGHHNEHPNEEGEESGAAERVPKRRRRLEKGATSNNAASLYQNHARVMAEDSSAISSSNNTDHIDRNNASVDRNDDRREIPKEKSHHAIRMTKEPTIRAGVALPFVKRKHSATRDYYMAPASRNKRGRRMEFREEDDFNEDEEEEDYCYVVPAPHKKRGGRTAIYKKYYVDADDDDEESQSDSEGSESSCSLCEKAALKAKYRNLGSNKRVTKEMRDRDDAAAIAALKREHREVAHHKSPGKDKTSRGASAENSLTDRRYSNAMMASELHRTASFASAVTNSSKNDNQDSMHWPTTASLNSSRDGAFLSSVPGHAIPTAYLPTTSSAGLPPGFSLNDANSLMQMPSTTISSAAGGGGMFVTTYVPPHQAVSLQQQLSQHQSLVRPQLSSNFFPSNLPAFGEVGGGVELPHPVHVGALGNRHPLLSTRPRRQVAQDPNFLHPSLPHFLHPR